MNKEMKEQIVSRLSSKLEQATFAILTDYRGLTVEQITRLRNELRGVSSDYQPGEDNVTRAYVVPKGLDQLYLNFPTGEVVDLTPFIRVKQIKG